MGLWKCTGWPVHDLDPRSRLWHRLEKNACLRDEVRTTHRITTKHCSFIAPTIVITWLDLEKFYWKLLFWQIFFKNFGCVFSRSNTILAISHEWLVRLMWNEKEMHRLDTGYNMWPWSLTSLMTLTLDVSRSNFEIAPSLELLVWLMWNEKEVSKYDTGPIYELALWPHPWPWPWSWNSKVRVWISVISGMGWPMTWNEKSSASHPFMTMILTRVTRVGWADVLDSAHVTSDVGVPSTYLGVIIIW